MIRIELAQISLGLSLFCLMTCLAAGDDLALKKRLNDLNAEQANHWIYNDIPAGFEEADRTGKPLFITFRCVPCVDCLGFDAEVADGNSAIKELAKEKFIAVRQIEMKGVDLTQFQFDHDLNWAAMFLNADGTVYARYGTQSAEGADAYNSVKGLLATMQRVLELHENYPANKERFAGKIPRKKPWKTALEMPHIYPALLKGGQTTRSNCVHCHNIHDAEIDIWQENGPIAKDKLWRYPLPQQIGLSLSVRDGRSITDVVAGSAAAAAGVQPGQKISTANGQAITSIADLQWVLHPLPNRANELIQVQFEDGKMATIKTSKNWKESDISWRASLWTVKPILRMWTPALTEAQKEEQKIDVEGGALQVKFINSGRPGGKAAYDAGVREGDVIIALNGQPLPSDNEHFNMKLKLNYKIGDTIELTVLRKGDRKTIKIPLLE
ncbi:MAG: Trx7/PDZ domain-containing (seleno)protein [Pirellulaceae bacterium]